MEALATLYKQVAPLREKIDSHYRKILIVISTLFFMIALGSWFLIAYEILLPVSFLGVSFFAITSILQGSVAIFGSNASQRSMKGWFIILVIVTPFYLILTLLEDPINAVLPAMLFIYVIIMLVKNGKLIQKNVDKIVEEQDIVRQHRKAQKTYEELELELMTHESTKPYPNVLESAGIICGAILWGAIAVLWLIGAVIRIIAVFSFGDTAMAGGAMIGAFIPFIIAAVILKRSINGVKHAFKDQLYKPSKAIPSMSIVGAFLCFIVFLSLAVYGSERPRRVPVNGTDWDTIYLSSVTLMAGILVLAFIFSAVTSRLWQRKILRWKLHAPDTTRDHEAVLLMEGRLA